MSATRFAVLGLARARSEWFRAVASWATSGAAPVSFAKCVSAEELRAHLAAGRRWSAALLDGGLPAVDRDLLDRVREAGAAPVVVEAAGVSRDWDELGAAGHLPSSFSREQLLDVLGSVAPPVTQGETLPPEPSEPDGAPAALAPVAAVCGPGGTGASTVAIALAQGLAAAREDPVLLTDLCLRADQAMLHDARDVVPGIQDLVEAHRGRRLRRDEIHAHTYEVAERGYHLLLGLRRARHWPSLRPRSFEAAFGELRDAFGTVVCDVTADFEGEADAGSLEVEERNVMARTAATQASAVMVVGRADMKGLHALVRLLGELDELGVEHGRIVPVVSAAPKSPHARAQIATALADLSGDITHGEPVFLPRRAVAEALRDGVALPTQMAAALADAFEETVRREGALGAQAQEPRLVTPGALGAWSPRGVAEL